MTLGGIKRFAVWRSRDFNSAFWIGLLAYTMLVVARRTFLSANSVAAIWPAAGVMAATFLLTPRRTWKWILLVAVIENIVANGLFGFALRTLLSIPESLLLAWLIQRTCPPSLNFAEPRTLTLFILKAVIPACLISATCVYFMPGPPDRMLAATRWFAGHALGAAIATPTFVTLLRPRRFRSFRRPAWELTAVTAIVMLYVTRLFGGHDAVLALLVFPMAMVVAFRYGPVGASTVSLLMMGLALLHIYAGIPGPRPTVYEEVAWVQSFVAVVFVTSLPAAGALASLRRTRRLLARRTQTARLARRRADQAAEAKTRFLANMSHEIRTPLNGVIGLADALSRTPLEAGQRDMLAMIQGSGRALNGILSDVLDLARADAGALALNPEPFDTGEAVGSASFLFASIARDKGVGFYVDFDLGHSGPVVGDALRIRQIVSNLISNAVKFTDKGSVRVSASLAPVGGGRAELTVAVADSGPGFDEETKARLFRRFEQADNAVVRRFGGTGLGLAISRELAEMMGGAIACQSAPGKGSTFTFRVILPTAEEAAPAASAPAEPDIVHAALNVLLAEDHPVNQRVVQAILGDSVNLTIVADGQAALDADAGQTFDLILMDTQMPVMDGLTATRAIREREARLGRPRTPIVSLTADAMPQQVQAALAAGACRHLAKPITAAALIDAMGQLLERKAA